MISAFLCPPLACSSPQPSPPATDPAEPTAQRIRARVAYDGTNYHGWQFQKDYATVQGELEAAISRKFGTRIRGVAASRTDTGVHARGQGVHFDVPVAKALAKEDLNNFQFTLNRMLPGDVRVKHIGIAPGSVGGEARDRLWHAVACATGKLYTYRISTGDVPDPMQRQYRYHEWRAQRFGFSEARLEDAVRRFEGAHDFSAFTNSSSAPPGFTAPVLVNPVRTVRSAKVVCEGAGCYRIEFRIDGAMYKMIRNIMGAVLNVAVGEMDLDYIDALFSSRDRRLSPKSAAARGLCLEEVFYDGWDM